MDRKRLVRVTTVPLSLDKLLEGQLSFMNNYFEIYAVSSDKNYLKTVADREGVKYKDLELTRKITPVKDLFIVVRLTLFLFKERPYIVHTHTPKAGIIGMLAAFVAGVPHRLHTVAGMPLMETNGIKRRILMLVERLTYACSSMIYPNSMGLHAFIESKKLTSPTKLKVLGNGSSNGIDTSHFSSEHFSFEHLKKLKKESGILTTDFVLTFIGRVVKDKGINELVQAFVELATSNEGLKLLIVGPFEQELNPISPQTFDQIKTHSQIIYTGFQNDVRPYLAITDLFVFPSYREGFPNVVLQAGAMGVPSIVSDINGCNEIIINNENGILIPVKSSDAIKESVLKLLENKTLMNAMKEKARNYIVSRFERKYFWDLLLKEYQSLENK